MKPGYREIILRGKLTPLGKLSAAFISPKRDSDTRFVYCESSLVAKYRAGHSALYAAKSTLSDLAAKSRSTTPWRGTPPLTKLEPELATPRSELCRATRPRVGLDEGQRAAQTRNPNPTTSSSLSSAQKTEKSNGARKARRAEYKPPQARSDCNADAHQSGCAACGSVFCSVSVTTLRTFLPRRMVTSKSDRGRNPPGAPASRASPSASCSGGVLVFKSGGRRCSIRLLH
jgi:hypothetical protein